MKHKIFNKHVKWPFPTTILQTLSLLLLMVIVGCTTGANGSELTPPPDFQPLAEVDLSTQFFSEEILGEFTLEETADTTIFYTLSNADTYLRLSGPDDASQVILHSENFRTDENGGGAWERSLTPGTYHLILTAQSGSGGLSFYWGHP